MFNAGRYVNGWYFPDSMTRSDNLYFLADLSWFFGGASFFFHRAFPRPLEVRNQVLAAYWDHMPVQRWNSITDRSRREVIRVDRWVQKIQCFQDGLPGRIYRKIIMAAEHLKTVESDSQVRQKIIPE